MFEKMNSIKRLFKKKITGKELEGLAEAFNVNLFKDFKAYDGWSAKNIYAKLNVVPKIDSLRLEAYFHSTQVHYPHLDRDDSSEAKYRKGICFERTKEIPYLGLNKLNLIYGDKK